MTAQAVSHHLSPARRDKSTRGSCMYSGLCWKMRKHESCKYNVCRHGNVLLREPQSPEAPATREFQLGTVPATWDRAEVTMCRAAGRRPSPSLHRTPCGLCLSPGEPRLLLKLAPARFPPCLAELSNLTVAFSSADYRQQPRVDSRVTAALRVCTASMAEPP